MENQGGKRGKWIGSGRGPPGEGSNVPTKEGGGGEESQFRSRLEGKIGEKTGRSLVILVRCARSSNTK